MLDLVPTTIMSLSVKGGPNDGNLTFPQFYEKFFFNYFILILRWYFDRSKSGHRIQLFYDNWELIDFSMLIESE